MEVFNDEKMARELGNSTSKSVLWFSLIYFFKVHVVDITQFSVYLLCLFDYNSTLVTTIEIKI